MTAETIAVPEIHCGHCKTSIEDALRPAPGVDRAEVDLEARTVAVDYDAQQTSRAELIALIEAQGYEVPDQA